MPEIGAAQYLASYWFELGLIGSGAMGPVAISATELLAWQQGSGNDLTPWEFKTLREMSRAYIASMTAAETPECPPPYGKQTEAFDRSLVSKKISNAFKAFIQAKK
ncbi:hypothetical protein [Flavobacterium sp.]|jgi:hypothetical protein|uniref:hypothetical protein n=1 Tax=Flavobacterium sp. TaxID=239 RepID=UPI0037BFC1DA